MLTILLIGMGVFTLSSVIFLVKGKKYTNAFLVSFINLISYIVMMEGSFLSTSVSGESLYWTRWVFYIFSCTLLMLTISKKLKMDVDESKRSVYLTAIVMLTGVFSSIFDGNYKWVMYIISSIAFLLLIIPILSSKVEGSKKISIFILLGWCVFPIVFLLSPEGLGVVNNSLSASIYLVLDILTKVMFYFVI